MRADKATIWAGCQAPILVKGDVAKATGVPFENVTVHVTFGGGAFGRRMFSNVMVEAAQISKAVGKPVKLMWDRTAEFRWGRTHPTCISAVRASYSGDNVLTFEQRHTSVATDFTEGFGEVFTAVASKLPLQNLLEYSETVFTSTSNVPYNFGVVDQTLFEIFNYDTFHTCSVRNLYSPDVNTTVELTVDKLAKAMGKDPYQFRRSFVKDPRARAVLDKAAQVGQWGRALPAGVAQGIAIHGEYHGWTACVAEIDNRPQTLKRTAGTLGKPDPKAPTVTGPRVTRLTYVVDVGLPINPLGLEAQMMGGCMDGIGEVLTHSLHLTDGNYQEGSWDQYFYTRQWNTPPRLDIVVMPPTTGVPGGAGEFGVAASKAATACAYARVTGTTPTSFPINHEGPLQFDDAYLPLRHLPGAAGHSHSRPPTGLEHFSTDRKRPCPKHTFKLNNKQVSVDCPDDLRLLWVIRDLLGVTRARSTGADLDVCKACTCHINGKAFNPCSVPVSQIKPTDEITTIEGLPATVGKPLHPVQEAWIDRDVPQCGYCQPGQIMAATALINKVKAEGGSITDDELDQIRNVCRCGTYSRIREAIQQAARPCGHGRLSFRACSRPGPLDDVAPDDLLHDLGGAPVDPGDAGIDVRPPDGVFGHVAVPAVELHRGVDGPTLQLGAPPLGHGRLLGRQLGFVEGEDALVDEGLGDAHLGGHLGQAEPGVLEGGHRSAERLALHGVGDGGIERGTGGGHAGHGDRQALLGQVDHKVAEPLALLAEQVLHRDDDVVEEQLGGVLGVQSDLVQVAAPLEAVHAPLEHHERHAGVTSLGIGLHRHDDQVGVDPVGDEGLRPVHHIVVAVADRRGPDVGQIRARPRLGHRHRRDQLTRADPRQPPGLLLLGGQVQEVGHADVVVQAEGQPGATQAGPLDLFVDYLVVTKVLGRR